MLFRSYYTILDSSKHLAAFRYTLYDINNFSFHLPKVMRPFKTMKHTIGTPVSEDVEVYHEADDAYHMVLFKTSR